MDKALQSDQNEPEFEIKNNVLIGRKVIYPESTNNVGEIILEIFKNKPDFIGQIDANTGRQATYKEMMDKSVKCAIWLKEQGINRGDVVAVCSSSYFDNYIAFLACTYIGAQCAVEYVNLPTRMFHRFLSIVTPKIIFLHKSALNNFIDAQNELNMNIQRVLFDDGISNEQSLNEILSKQTETEIGRFRCEVIENPKEVALLICTSGSTGFPKIAELSYLSLKTLMSSSCIKDMLNRPFVCSATMRWILYFIYLLSGFRAGSTKIVVDDLKDAKYYYEIIKKYKVGYFLADSNQLREIYKVNLMDDCRKTDLKTITFGGSPFDVKVYEALTKQLPQINIFQIYGLTDVGGCVFAQKQGCKPGSCGYIVPGYKMKVVCTETGVALSPNKQGKIYIMSDTQMNGYRNNPEATKRAIDSDGWFQTNDIGYYDEDGEVYIVGRMSEFIKYKDICLSVSEMEAILDTHPAVYKAVVVPMPVEIEGELPVAIVKKLPNKQVDERDLLLYFANNMPEFYTIGYVKFVNDLPFTNTGKIARNDLKQMLHKGLI